MTADADGLRIERHAANDTVAIVRLERPQRRNAMDKASAVALTECASRESHCSIETSCLVGRAWQRVNLAIRRSLQEITLLELAGLSGGGAHPSALDRGFPVSLGSIGTRSLKREPL